MSMRKLLATILQQFPLNLKIIIAHLHVYLSFLDIGLGGLVVDIGQLATFVGVVVVLLHFDC